MRVAGAAVYLPLVFKQRRDLCHPPLIETLKLAWFAVNFSLHMHFFGIFRVAAIEKNKFSCFIMDTHDFTKSVKKYELNITEYLSER